MSNKVNVVGEPTQIEINGKRFYRVSFSDGTYKNLRSVTTICKGARLPSFLDEWERQQCEALGVAGYLAALQQKADDGTALHKLIEEHINGKDYDIQDVEIKKMFESYLRWEARRKPRWIFNEKLVFSLQYDYAGRCDGKAQIENRIPIIDFKSAKRAQNDHKEQGSAYLMADSEMKPEIHADSVLILCLGAENKQGYTETWLDNPYDIAQHFMGFNLKNNLVNFHNPA